MNAIELLKALRMSFQHERLYGSVMPNNPVRVLTRAMAASIAARRKSAFFTSPRTASIRSEVPSFTRKDNCSVKAFGLVTC